MTADSLLLSASSSRTDKPWPYRPRPLPDEIFLSYLIRIATGLDLKLQRFVSAIWGSDHPLLHQDLDSFAPAHVIIALSIGTGADAAAIEATTLRSYDGWLTDGYSLRGRKTWVLPTAIASGHRLRHGQQFCPNCLAGGGGPYLRRTWRLAFATVCTTHGTGLLDACPTCQSVLHPHRAPSLRHCFKCATDLARLPAAAVDPETVEWQRSLEATLAEGGGNLGSAQIWSQALFATVRQIAALLVNGPRASALRETTAALYGGNPEPFMKPTRRQPLEYLAVDERRRLFDLVRRLMTDWPMGFVSACEGASLFRSHAIKDMPMVPFVFESMLRDHLDRTPYSASDGEVEAAAHWLRRTDGFATYKALKAICGESRTAIYNHMDYVRRPSTLSRFAVEAVRNGTRKAGAIRVPTAAYDLSSARDGPPPRPRPTPGIERERSGRSGQGPST